MLSQFKNSQARAPPGLSTNEAKEAKGRKGIAPPGLKTTEGNMASNRGSKGSKSKNTTIWEVKYLRKKLPPPLF